MPCFYCGKDFSDDKTQDHVLPLSRRGSSSKRNLVDACLKCNQLKGILNLEEFRLVVAYRKKLIPPADYVFPGER